MHCRQRGASLHHVDLAEVRTLLPSFLDVLIPHHLLIGLDVATPQNHSGASTLSFTSPHVDNALHSSAQLRTGGLCIPYVPGRHPSQAARRNKTRVDRLRCGLRVPIADSPQPLRCSQAQRMRYHMKTRGHLFGVAQRTHRALLVQGGSPTRSGRAEDLHANHTQGVSAGSLILCAMYEVPRSCHRSLSPRLLAVAGVSSLTPALCRDLT